MTIHRRRAVGVALAAALVGIPAVVVWTSAPQAASSRSLNGTFRLQAGTYSNGKAHGTYFRMIYPNGKKYFPNPDSTAADKTYILGRAGKDGGLITGRYQPNPKPAFDSKGNARANGILRPGTFTAIKFSAATLKVDPQSDKNAAAPSASVNGRTLTVRLPSYTIMWNGEYFNQGAPKPDGSGSAASGRYDPSTKRFAFDWKSKIRGGPFNGFSGYWHFEGTFDPR